MSFDEMKAKGEELLGKVAELEQSEDALFAELGRKVLPEITEESEHVSLAEQIGAMGAKLNGLRREKEALDKEYEAQVIACTCLYCMELNPVGATFCEGCGKRLGEIPPGYCKTCGRRNDPEAVFCDRCGIKLADQQ